MEAAGCRCCAVSSSRMCKWGWSWREKLKKGEGHSGLAMESLGVSFISRIYPHGQDPWYQVPKGLSESGFWCSFL